MYSLQRLRLLREVSLRGSLAAAAEALGYNPSSVSHQLKALEAEVGTLLLEPVGRGVRLTEAAKVLVTHTEAVIGELEAAEAELAALSRTVRGTLRVAAFQTALHTIVPPAVARLQDRHPELEILTAHIDAEEGIPALLAHDFDLVLQEDYPSQPSRQSPGVQIETLGTDPLHLITAAAESAGTEPHLGEHLQLSERLQLSDRAERPWAMETTGARARQWTQAECRRAGFEPRVAFETSDVILQVRLVSLGLADALVPDLALRGAEGLVNTSAIVRSELPGRPQRTISTAVRSGSSRTPSIAALRAALSDYTQTC